MRLSLCSSNLDPRSEREDLPSPQSYHLSPHPPLALRHISLPRRLTQSEERTAREPTLATRLSSGGASTESTPSGNRGAKQASSAFNPDYTITSIVVELK